MGLGKVTLKEKTAKEERGGTSSQTAYLHFVFYLLLKFLLNLLQYCFCFMFWIFFFFCLKACGILAPQPGIELIPPELES